MTSFVENFPGELSVDHLSTEAIAALVDGELSRRAEHRAKIHLVHCETCRAEVRAQRSAAHRLREHASAVHTPGGLMEKLQRIPDECDEDEAPHRFSVDGCRRPETLVDRVDLLLRKLSFLGK
ncbi:MULTISPECIES: zf-HC2 domain-containing protein [Corynebacterium]|uniref:anti-sigma factor family protein n=1 Tax=Corynebacterium TaxID=1716 RepID=UPI000886D0F8|nr:zf-HC2 domain-containing protein [Corynebacterium jeikeium]SCX19247.1 putative transmembrane transcriptional regulator (anti-sigma factor) [Corynebacterium jeikeium]